MSTIKKKILPECFDAVASGKKKFELRLDDFEIVEGDTLLLEEWDPVAKAYTGRSIEKKVTYVLPFRPDDFFGQEEEIKEKGMLAIAIE
jgi:hypothetical protein